MNNAISNMRNYSKRRAIISIACCCIVTVVVFIGVLIHIFYVSSDSFGNNGSSAFRMFTVLSNMLVAVCSLLCIPYQIDGLRYGNYHMPRWIMNTLYVGVTGVSITMIISACVLSPAAGFVRIMFGPAGLYIHTIGPLTALLMFIFITTDHRIHSKAILLAMIPVLIYAVVYITMAFIIGPDRGGWTDHYSLNTYLPWPITCSLLLAATSGIAALLRLAHNKMHSYIKEKNARLYSDAFMKDCADIDDAIGALAGAYRQLDNGRSDIIVPRHSLMILEAKYQSGKSEQDICSEFIEKYYSAR